MNPSPISPAVHHRTNRAAKRAELEQRREKVAELVLAKVPQREIAERLDVSHGAVCDDVRALRRAWTDRAYMAFDAHVAEEVAKLDRLEATVLPKAFDGDLNAADRAVKIMDRRARLLGLDGPVKLRVDAEPTQDIEELRARALTLLDELQAKRARERTCAPPEQLEAEVQAGVRRCIAAQELMRRGAVVDVVISWPIDVDSVIHQGDVSCSEEPASTPRRLPEGSRG